MTISLMLTREGRVFFKNLGMVCGWHLGIKPQMPPGLWAQLNWHHLAVTGDVHDCQDIPSNTCGDHQEGERDLH